MYSLRLTIYLVPIALTIIAGNFIHRAIAKAETNLQKIQSSPVKFSEARKLAVHYSKVQYPSIKFPQDTYPEVKLPEITSEQIRVQENQHLTIITLPADILFEDNDNKNIIRQDAEKTLRQVSQAINNRYPDTWLQILGHSDSKGSKDDNLKLSEEWVTAVQRWLSEKGGIDVSLMTKEGYGETQPIAPNTKSHCSDNIVGRQKNSRIEIVIQKLQNNQV